jgi:predicted metal-dependent HD superfamily phosphohydrolase
MATTGPELRERWIALAKRWGAQRSSAGAGFDAVVTRYGEAHRRYHTLDHIASVLAALDDLVASEPVTDAPAVQFAGWLHDVVYDPTRPDNEVESARYARRALSMIRAPKAVADETARLIELTAGHEVAPGDRDAMVLIDADLSILGAPPAGYDHYAADIRAEYGHVADADFRTGRRRILEGFLGRERIFLTDTGHGLWEVTARSNLAREIDRLR